jgi:DNA-binding protein HU-beta
MSKAAMIDVIAHAGDLNKKQAEVVLISIANVLAHELKSNDKFDFPGIGAFKVTVSAARKGRNPATGDEIDIPAARRIKFKPCKSLKDYV